MKIIRSITLIIPAFKNNSLKNQYNFNKKISYEDQKHSIQLWNDYKRFCIWKEILERNALYILKSQRIFKMIEILYF